MARLPRVGGDDGNWGVILNDYLSKAHEADGSLKSSALPIASATNEGVVQLAGDLAGTSTAPTVPALASKYVKPPSGIPEADLAEDVQDKLNTDTGTDADVAGYLNDDSSQTRAALSDSIDARMKALGAPQFESIRAALRGGRSACIWGTGDSTWDTSNGVTVPRPLNYLASEVAALFPDYHVVTRSWDAANDRWGADVVVNIALGRRYVNNGLRSLRYRKATPPVLSTGNLDVRALVSANNWATAQQVVAASSAKEVAGVVSAEHSWQLMVDAGNLRLRASSDGTTVNSLGSWARPLSGHVNGQPLWIRCTIEISASPQRLVKFYTSTDGAAWTQLGATFTEGFSTPLHVPAAGSFLEIGAYGWQPAALPFSGKIYEVQVRDDVDGPMVGPALPELWEKYPDLQATFGGSPEFRILNASASGKDIAFHTNATRLPRATPDFGQSVLTFCDSHNEAALAGDVGWLTPLEDWVESVQARLPRASVVLVKQNPHTTQNVNEGVYGSFHKQRLDELARLAAQHGWGLLDLYAAFLNDPAWDDTGGTLMQSDGIHPSNPAGYSLGGDALITYAGITERLTS